MNYPDEFEQEWQIFTYIRPDDYTEKDKSMAFTFFVKGEITQMNRQKVDMAKQAESFLEMLEKESLKIAQNAVMEGLE